MVWLVLLAAYVVLLGPFLAWRDFRAFERKLLRDFEQSEEGQRQAFYREKARREAEERRKPGP